MILATLKKRPKNMKGIELKMLQILINEFKYRNPYSNH